MSANTTHDLLAYILVRFSLDLINFPFEGKRYLSIESIIKAKKLSKDFLPYQIKLDYNEKFFIDNERKLSFPPTEKNIINEYLSNLFKSNKFINIINHLYNNTVYEWAKAYSTREKYVPLRHGYGLFAIAKTLEDLSLNNRYFINQYIEKYNKSDILENQLFTHSKI